jgi:glutathione synthase/RimK-type ligase-like ATP-grasp enzyme
MAHHQRIFVDAICKYCAGHGIAVEVRSDGWLIAMQRGSQRRLAFGYDLGLNSAVAHRIANDKAATSEVLSLAGIASVPHSLFLNPRLHDHVPPAGSWEVMLAQLAEHPRGIVVKPNEGTSGRSVFLVTSQPKLELAANRIFASHASLAISPYLDIEHEIRVVLLDDAPLVVYSKNRPSVIGDGERSLLELAIAATSAEQRAAVLRGMTDDLARYELDAIVPAGERRMLNWRHNLDAGSQPILLRRGEPRDVCVALAVKAAETIGIRFASVDVIRADGRWLVLEINSGVMMESLSRFHPALVQAGYEAALDKVFGSPST